VADHFSSIQSVMDLDSVMESLLYYSPPISLLMNFSMMFSSLSSFFTAYSLFLQTVSIAIYC
jgi:hypothetical protein